MFRLASVTLVILGLSLEASATCCEDQLNCWETCMIPPASSTREYKKAYTGIYQLINGIRSLYAPCNEPHGTAYMMDSAVPSIVSASNTANVFAYQRHLASIIALTHSASNTCNQFCASKYYRNFAYYAHSWTCKNRCEAAQVLNSPAFQGFTVDGTSSWVGGGEILSKLCFDRPHLNHHKCMRNSSNELLISFTNSPMYWTPPSPSYCSELYHCAVIGTNPASSYPNMDSWAHSGSAYQLPADNYHMKAAQNILRCMNQGCCPKQFGAMFPLREATEDESLDENNEDLDTRANERLTFNYLSSNYAASKGPSTYTGTYKDFQRTIVNPMTSPRTSQRIDVTDDIGKILS